MRVCSFLCSDSLLYTSFFFFLLYVVFIHVIVHVYRLLAIYNHQYIGVKYVSEELSLRISYSGKIWRALNLVKTRKTVMN